MGLAVSVSSFRFSAFRPTFGITAKAEVRIDQWRKTLAAGNSARAWDEFIQCYRRLIIAVIRRMVADEEDAADVFAEVCANLASDDLAILARHTEPEKTRFSMWLVTVVRHRTIDWLRHRDGRRRICAPASLSEIQKQIF